MNVVREIGRINAAELDIALTNPSASWHEQYKDSAYLFIGGLPYDLTEGDVITIFSQFGEVVDVHLPRGPGKQQQQQGEQQQQKTTQDTGKHRGFGFLMYQDQRSTVLAVDNLNGAQVLGRTLRVDHVANYQQPKTKLDDGTMVQPETQSFNAAPVAGPEDDGLEDPMAAYIRKHSVDPDKQRRKQERARIRAERELRRQAKR